MSSILSAFKFRSSDDTNSKVPEVANSASEVKPQEISAPKTDVPGATEEKKKPSPCCCCKETKQKRDVWYVLFADVIMSNSRMIAGGDCC